MFENKREKRSWNKNKTLCRPLVEVSKNKKKIFLKPLFFRIRTPVARWRRGGGIYLAVQ